MRGWIGWIDRGVMMPEPLEPPWVIEARSGQYYLDRALEGASAPMDLEFVRWRLIKAQLAIAAALHLVETDGQR